MYAVVGTVPDEDFPLISGEISLNEDQLSVAGQTAPVNRGTPALLAAAFKAGEVLGQDPPFAFLAGDTGLGKGSRSLYEYLENKLKTSATDFRAIVFHYLQPDVDWHNRVLFAIQNCAAKNNFRTPPILIADAGFMYAAKMSGLSHEYDLFTPDVGELAFLADEEAPHPFYTRGFILHEENNVPALTARAYLYKNAAKNLLVKGKRDYIVRQGDIIESVDNPVNEAMEAIGGTGDTLTGIVTALIASGLEITQAAVMAARVNRLAGYSANPDPATQVMEIISHIPKAMEIENHEIHEIHEMHEMHEKKYLLK
jgi:hypothetical protein